MEERAKETVQWKGKCTEGGSAMENSEIGVEVAVEQQNWEGVASG